MAFDTSHCRSSLFWFYVLLCLIPASLWFGAISVVGCWLATGH